MPPSVLLLLAPFPPPHPSLPPSNTQINPAYNWEDAEWLVQEWGGKTALKGVCRPDDAVKAVDAGFSTIWVSNHGGRQVRESVYIPPVGMFSVH